MKAKAKNIGAVILALCMGVSLFFGAWFALQVRAEDKSPREYYTIFKDSYGSDKQSAIWKTGALTQVSSNVSEGSVALALDCTQNYNTEFYIDFGEELDFSDTNTDAEEFFSSASVEFDIKFMDTPGGFFNAYLFMSKDGVYGDDSVPVNEWYYRSTVQLSKYVDAAKIGQWQHVQIPVSAFSASADTVENGQKVTGAAVMEFSKVRGIGFAHMFGTNATYKPTVKPTVYYDDIKIMLDNLPDPYLGCKMVQYAEFAELDVEFTPVDLRPYATTGYTGGSGIGWTNQGADNELTGFDLTGKQVFNNVEFDIIDQEENNNKSVIGLRSKKASESPLFTESVTIPIGRKADGAYMIHNMSWEDKTVARYTWVYEDGTQEQTDILNGRHIFNWWMEEQSDVCPIIWKGSNAEASGMGIATIKLNMFAFKNPQPQKVIKEMKFEIVSETAADMIVAITLADFAGTDDFYMCFGENPYNPDTSNWYEYQLADLESLVGSTLDVSYLLDPADHGHLTAKGDDFVFEDGTKAEFWGTNVSGKMIFSQEDNKETLELLVDVLAACGYNLVRIMDWDASFYYPNIFGNANGWDGATVSEQQLDQLHYFWSLCKERGIYIQFCMVGGRTGATDMVSGKLTEEEVADIGTGLKFEVYIDERLEESTKDLLRTVLGTQNKYTGIAPAQDSSLAMVEIANESNLTALYGVYASNTSYEFVSEEYKALFREKFNQFLSDEYGSTAALKDAWAESGKTGLDSRTESLGEGTVKIDQRYLQSNYSAQRCADTFRFLYTLQYGFYERMANWAKNPVEEGGLGMKCIFAGTQNLSLSDRNDLFLNAHFDYIARHSYQSHPTTGTEYGVGTATGNSQSMIPAWTGNALAQAGYRKVIGIPYIVNEINEAEPNVHTAEFNLIAAAIFSYQGWSATHFTFGTRSLDNRMNIIDNSFTYLDNPTRFSTIASSSLLYFRNEITQAETGYYRVFTVDESMQYNSQSMGLPDGTYIVGKTGIYFADNDGNVLFYDEEVDVSYESDQSLLEKIRHSLLTSAGGEIVWSTKDRQFLLNTPYTQAVVGEVAGELHSFRDVEITTSTEFVNITVSALGKDKDDNVALDKTIADADRILVTAVARARNKGQELTSDGNTITQYGSTPVIVEQVEGQIVFKTFDTFEVYILNSSGVRTQKKANVTKDERGYTVLTMQIGDETTYYELVRTSVAQETPDLGVYKDVEGELRTVVEEMAEALPSVTSELYLPDELTERGDFVGGVVRALALTSDNARAYADADSFHQAYEEFKVARGLELIAGLQIDAYSYITKADAYYALYMGLKAKGIAMTEDTAAIGSAAGFDQLSEEAKAAIAALVSVKVLKAEDVLAEGVNGYLTRGDAATLLYLAKNARDAEKETPPDGGTSGGGCKGSVSGTALIAGVLLAVAGAVLLMRKKHGTDE